MSNPELWDFVAKLRIEELKQKPALLAVSVSKNDGGTNKFCMCDRCHAWAPPEAPKLFNKPQLIDPKTKQPFAEYPSLSDREFRFFDEIARRVDEQLPGRGVACYAYSVYRTPPVRITRLEPNLIVGFVGLESEAIDGWSKVATQLVVRPNDVGPYNGDFGLPRNSTHFLAQGIKFSTDRRVTMFDFAGG